ncbi:MAG: hypothetical protein GTN99_02135, partial [Candidatus Dadabacteria bacterium]|nr:hypothetical protein [Candidatus Dadabacteria bacterium]
APTDKVGSSRLAKASLKFDDIAAKKPVSLSKDLDYKVTKKMGLVIKNENKEVGARALSMDVASEFYRAAGDYENGKLEDARRRMLKSISNVQKLNSSPHRTSETVEQERALREALDELSNNAPEPSSIEAQGLIKKYKAQSREQQK